MEDAVDHPHDHAVDQGNQVIQVPRPVDGLQAEKKKYNCPATAVMSSRYWDPLLEKSFALTGRTNSTLRTELHLLKPKVLDGTLEACKVNSTNRFCVMCSHRD
ncbi:hypothetical protein CAPTEDRAFT_197050 [Capitella teleta]|uniref:Uncharacterized protein n=1 Tax=Capitella teleta TaxID=283909 RepID=R7V6G6_CAPTE|nr:hypothetical protein CAPTEDRAFT_197050 [Capitella teleta]|eukprot:ELU14057.1 hypothetical protein CAPTEDRAFT_197050 [Capitella teleta]